MLVVTPLIAHQVLRIKVPVNLAKLVMRAAPFIRRLIREGGFIENEIFQLFTGFGESLTEWENRCRRIVSCLLAFLMSEWEGEKLFALDESV